MKGRFIMTLEPELTYPVFWSDVPNNGVSKKITATTQECRKLAEMLDVVSLSHVEADFEITRWRRSGLKVAADIRADVVQNCVVNLETVSSSLNEQTEWFFKPEVGLKKNNEPETVLQIDPSGEDPADPLIDGRINLGDLLAEHLCLMIDPFMRSPLVEFDAIYENLRESPASGASNISPFAILKQIGKTHKV